MASKEETPEVVADQNKSATGETENIADDTEMTMDDSSTKENPEEVKTEAVKQEGAEKNDQGEKEGNEKGKDEPRKLDPETEEELKIRRVMFLSAVTETVVIKPIKYTKCTEPVYHFVFGKSKELSLEFKDGEGTATCSFHPNRDWRARFIIKGICKMKTEKPETTIECTPLFQELLDSEAAGDTKGLFHSQMTEFKSLFVNGLPQGTTEDQLKGFFPKCTKIHLPCLRNGNIRGWAVVEFGEKENADESYDNQKTFEIGETTVKVIRMRMHEELRTKRVKQAAAGKAANGKTDNQQNDKRRPFRRGQRRRRNSTGPMGPRNQDDKPKDGNQDLKRRNNNNPQQNNQKKMRMGGPAGGRDAGNNRNVGRQRNTSGGRQGGQGGQRRQKPYKEGIMGVAPSSLLGVTPLMGSGMGMSMGGGRMGMGGMGMMGMGGMGQMGQMGMGMGMNSSGGMGNQWSGGMDNSMNKGRNRARRGRNRNDFGGRGGNDDDYSMRDLSSKLDKVTSNPRSGKDGDKEMIAMLQSALTAAQRRLGEPDNDKDSGDMPGNRQNRNQGNRRGNQQSFDGSIGGFNRQSSTGTYDSTNYSSSYDTTYPSPGYNSSDYWKDDTKQTSNRWDDQYKSTDQFNRNTSTFGATNTYSSITTGQDNMSTTWDKPAASTNNTGYQEPFSNYNSGYGYNRY